MIGVIPVPAGMRCSAPLCEATPLYFCGYDHLAGKRGKAATTVKVYCSEHAQQFAKKYRLQMPS